MTEPEPYTQPAVAGSGTIACALAASASVLGEVRLLARSDASAWRAEERAQEECAKVEGADAGPDQGDDRPDRPLRVRPRRRGGGRGARRQGRAAGRAWATPAPRPTWRPPRPPSRSPSWRAAPAIRTGCSASTSSTPSTGWSWSSCACPTGCGRASRERALAWCRALGKTAIEVPDQPGFVVNRLLFPYLFDAVRLAERTGMESADVDSCLELGAGHPMGPLRLLDFIGLDVAAAIGESLFADTRRGALPGSGADRGADRRRQGGPQERQRASTSTGEARRRCACACRPGPRSRRPRRSPGAAPRRSPHPREAGPPEARPSAPGQATPALRASAGPRCSSARSTARRTSSCLSVSFTTHMPYPSGR